MPTYVYKFIETGETVEIQQSFSDDTLTEAVHPESGEVMAVRKVFQPVGVTFKGDGFYKTDSRSSKSSSAPSSSTSTSDTSTASTASTASTTSTTTSSGDSSSSSSSTTSSSDN